MTFAYGHVLWLLLIVLPALVIFFWWAWRERQRLMTQFIQARLLPGLISGVSPTRQKVRFVLITVAFAFLIIALGVVVLTAEIVLGQTVLRRLP